MERIPDKGEKLLRYVERLKEALEARRLVDSAADELSAMSLDASSNDRSMVDAIINRPRVAKVVEVSMCRHRRRRRCCRRRRFVGNGSTAHCNG